ncbi:MAG TPA: glycosyltransferase [bacterium]|jgi:glycosyltransferase involved in cell wall biosynthesis|nr:glycosyltransferase [bacterium]HNZ51398.1 glycosyltransferase [bacterium]HOF79832.1 glycosyltransferase [bacterium]HOH85438.1 glycosyltransferase [bacterium]HOQ91743.1 glycosyltransferase [bacterium]
MKIILANNTFYPYQRGGAEAIVRRLAEDWSAAGHQVMVVALRPIKSRKDNLKYTPQGYKINYWPSRYYDLENYSCWRKLWWHLPDWLGIRYLTKWLKILRSFQPDLVVANNLTGLGFSLHFCCQRLGIASAQIFHDVQYLLPSGLLVIGREQALKSWSARIYQVITAFWLAPARLLISPSQWLMTCHRQVGWLARARWQQLPNPINVRLAAEYRLPDNLRRAIFVGQLSEAKGILWLADQWADFNRQLAALGFNEVDLLVAGDGPLSDHLRLLAGQDRRLILLGHLTSSQVAEQLASADVLLSPSFCYENWPTVLLESAAAGCLAISSSHGGGGELADNLGYLTFKAGDFNSLLDVWRQLAITAAKIKSWPANNLNMIDSNDYLQKIISATKNLD